jgi:hypothetical protein
MIMARITEMLGEQFGITENIGNWVVRRPFSKYTLVKLSIPETARPSILE